MTKSLKHDLKADHILEKGMGLLWSKGYNGTSVNDIVKEADIPKGSFYFYFKSKEDFVVKALEKYFMDQFSPVRALLEDQSNSAKKRLTKFYEHRASMLTEEMSYKMGCMALNIGNEMSTHSEKIRKAITNKELMMRSLITKVIKEAQENGEIKISLKAEDLCAFIEDAGKGAMVTMKELQSTYPIEIHMKILKKIIFR